MPASLQTLSCSQNLLTSLVALPTGLQNLDCQINQLTSLPTLPAGLLRLNCYVNQLTNLPALPASLQNLDCDTNQLTGLPTLPATLVQLLCYNNPLMSLPALPASLLELLCTNNLLTSLPALPASLVTLSCANNQLTSLPALPVSLGSLSCANNLLDFADLEPINPKPATYSANPQSYIILPTTQNVSIGNPLTISGGVGGTLNVYQWYKNSTLISGATSATFSIPAVATTDAGVYRCQVTSTFVGAGTTTGVTITSSNVTVNICPVAISPTSLPNATIGTTYNQTITQTGLTGTPTWSISVGALPASFTINATTGIISGTPAATGTFNFTVRVTDGTCTQTRALSIVIICPTIAITPAFTTAQNYTVGTAVNITLGASGAGSATYTYAVTSGSLPAGTALASGVISGTPTTVVVSGSFTVTATSSFGACTGTQVYNYTVACPALVFTNTVANGATVGTPYTLNAGVTGNTQSVVYGISPALSAGLNLNIATGVISGTPTAPATSVTYTVTATQGTCNIARTYTFAVACTGISITTATLPNGTIGVAYNQTITQTGLTGTPVWSISAGTLPNGLAIAGGTGVISGTLGATGSFTFTVQAASSGCFATQSYTVVVACPVITFTNTVASGGVINTPYTLNAGVTGNNATLTYSVSPTLPAGLSINTATGVISGTPTALTTSATYTVTADQSGGVCIKTQTYTFGVTNCVAFALSPNTNFLPNGFANVPYVGVTISVAAPVAGVTYKYFKRNAINWQTGLTLNENTGIISGTPSFSTSINVVIEAVNQTTGCGSILTSYTLVIFPDPTTAIDNSLENIVKVSPNPSSGDFNVDFGTINMAKSFVRVYDAQGKIIFTSENNSSTNGNLMVISLDKFANGIYLMEVETSKGRVLKRLAKQ